MDKYDLIALLLRSNGGQIEDRTALQKLAYFANLRLGIDGVEYKDYFYGPFSKGVAIALDDLASSLFIRETVWRTTLERYSYELTADGSDLADRSARDNRRECEEIDRVVDTCKKHCELRARPLSYAAKVHYMLQDGGGRQDAPTLDIPNMAHDFGWNMTDQEIECGITLLQKLEQELVAS